MNEIVYFDNAATSHPKPESVYKATAVDRSVKSDSILTSVAMA